MAEDTLRDQLTEAYETHVEPAAEPAAPPSGEAPASPPAGEAAAPAAAPTGQQEGEAGADRARDPKTGQFVTQPKEKQPLGRPATPGVQAAAVAERLGIKHPDSWKKEMWPIWEKIDAGEALTKDERKSYLDYQIEREGQYTKGVSAYKAEAEHARQLIAAIAPYQPMMQSQGLTPEKFITALANTHQTLSAGSREDKLRAFARFAQDYQIPLHELFIQGEDGKIYLNQQHFSQPEPKPMTPQDISAAVQAETQRLLGLSTVQQFQAAKDEKGNPAYPHFEKVRQTMKGLLQSGVVPATGNLLEDLKAAYDASLRLPQHAELYAEIQQQSQKAAAEAKAREEAEKAARAKAAAVSVKSDAPTGPENAKGGKKSLRSQLSEAYDSTVAGRI